MKRFATFLLIVTLGFAAVSSLGFGVAYTSTDQNGIISADTTWASAGNPYLLTGPVAVKGGVTLTIESGATVNLNNFYIQVNGTLIIRGTASSPVTISGGSLTYTSVGNGWNPPTGSGCLIEYTNFNSVTVSSAVALEVNNCFADSSISVAGSSAVTGSNLKALSVTDDSVVTNNNIGSLHVLGGTPTISDNNIQLIDGSAGSPTISNNIIDSIGGYSSNNTMPSQLAGSAPMISGNTISRGIQLTASFPVITNNVILGYLYGEGMTINDGYGPTDNSYSLYGDSAIIAVTANSGSPVIYNNTLTGHNYIYTHETFDYGMRSTETIGVMTAGIVVSGTYANPTISQNVISDCSTGIEAQTEGKVTIDNNYISNTQASNLQGIVVTSSKQVLIEHNYVDQRLFFDGTENLLIRNNTIFNATIGIRSVAPSTLIYNNIEVTSGYSLFVDSSGNVDAANNWWGKTDIEAISRSIYDNKKDFNLGTATFMPILNSKNLQAMPQLNEPISGITYPIPAPSTQTSSPTVQPQQQTPPSSGANNATQQNIDWAQVALYTLLTVIAIALCAIALLLYRRNKLQNAALRIQKN